MQYKRNKLGHPLSTGSPGVLESILTNMNIKIKGDYPIQELQLQINQNDKQDQQLLKSILQSYLSYPSTQIAEIHRNSNKLGEHNKNQLIQQRKSIQNILRSAQMCPCCGLIQQTQTIPICTKLKDINHLGISTHLYFMTLLNLILLLLIMLLIYCIYSLITNINASNQYKQALVEKKVDNTEAAYDGLLILSLGSKRLHETPQDRQSYTIQCWLGVAVIVIWGFAFFVIKYFERRKQVETDIKIRTASDYSIQISNLRKDINETQLSNLLTNYCKRVQAQGYYMDNNKYQIKVQKINRAIPFYLRKEQFQDKRLEQVNQQYQKCLQKFAKWIKQRVNSPVFLTTTKKQIKQTQQYFIKLKQERQNLYKQITDNILTKMQKENMNRQYDIAFVTLDSSFAADFLKQVYDEENYFLKCLFCKNQKQRYVTYGRSDEKQDIIRIHNAPQPEDIIWMNLGQSFSSRLKKAIIIYLLTFIILGISFVINYGLSTIQVRFEEDDSAKSAQYVSILLSICISAINIIIKVFLQYLTKIQRNATYTKHQTGLALKGVFFSLLNSILIPILVNYFIKKNLFGINGLSYDVFILGITNSLLNPLLTLFNPLYILSNLIRNYKSRPENKLLQNQNQLNILFQYMEFQIGYEYIYMVNLFIFTCFFAPLQPIIVLFAICGLSLTYWVQKYVLLNRCKRPIPGNNVVNTTMYQFIYFGPAAYTLGSFCWSHFFKIYQDNQFIPVAANLAAAIISFLILIIPYKSILKKCCYYQKQQQRIYQNDLLFLPSQYDRLNPATAQDGVALFKFQLLLKIQQMQNNPQLKGEIYQIFLRQIGSINRYSDPVFPELANFLSINNNNSFNTNNIMIQSKFGYTNNIINPLITLNALFPQSESMNIAIQNWFGNQGSQRNSHVPKPNIQSEIDFKKRMQLQDNKNSPAMTTSKRNSFRLNDYGEINLAIFDFIDNNNTGNIQNRTSNHNIPLNLPINLFGGAMNLMTQPRKSRPISGRINTQRDNQYYQKSPEPLHQNYRQDDNIPQQNLNYNQQNNNISNNIMNRIFSSDQEPGVLIPRYNNNIYNNNGYYNGR